MIMMNKKGTILISSLWIVAILTVFAVSIGRQSSIALKLTSYDVDNLKAYFIARAGILRSLAEKNLEYRLALRAEIDALSQDWANNKELFDRHQFGSGSYTVGYKYPVEEEGENPTMLYGLMDEESKININIVSMEAMANLTASFGIDRDDAEEMAAAIVDWRDEDSEITSQDRGSFYGAEDVYYQGISPPYHCKNSRFDTIYELTLARGVTKELFNKMKPYITVYGEGRVNINTASEVVLNALFGPDFPDLASKIIRYRKGNDEIIGTKDDRWFSKGSYMIDREDKGLIAIKNLQDAEWYANIYGISTEGYNRIRELIKGDGIQLSVNSMTYRAVVSAEVERVNVKIEAVYSFENRDKPPLLKFWYQEQ